MMDIAKDIMAPFDGTIYANLYHYFNLLVQNTSQCLHVRHVMQQNISQIVWKTDLQLSPASNYPYQHSFNHD